MEQQNLSFLAEWRKVKATAVEGQIGPVQGTKG